MTAPSLPRRSALLLPLAVALPHRARAAMPPIVDAAGRTIVLPRRPERIVIIFSFEEFTAVGGADAWSRVVGIGRKQWAGYRQANFTRFAAAIPGLDQLPDVGIADDRSFSVERTLSLRPDLLILHEYGFRAMAPLMAQIEQAGVPILVVDYNAQLPAKHVASTLALGAITGAEDRARALSELYVAKSADIDRRIAGVTPRRAYVEAGVGGAGTFGNSYNGTMWGRMLELAGATNIATAAIPPGWAPMTPEAVLAAEPEFVFITGSSWTNAPNAVRLGYGVDAETARRSLAPYVERAGWQALPAVRTGEVHALETGLARSLYDWVATQYIARQVHPAAFSDVDPVDSLRRYHEAFLPVPFSGTWMTRLGSRPS